MSSANAPSVASELAALLSRLGFDVVIRDPSTADIVAHSPGAETELLAAEPGAVRVAAARVAGVAVRVEVLPHRAEALDLTPRQMAVARLLEKGKRNKDIAAALKISTHTVRRHLEQMFRRLGVRNRAGAVLIIRKHERRGSAVAVPRAQRAPRGGPGSEVTAETESVSRRRDAAGMLAGRPSDGTGTSRS